VNIDNWCEEKHAHTESGIAARNQTAIAGGTLWAPPGVGQLNATTMDASYTGEGCFGPEIVVRREDRTAALKYEGLHHRHKFCHGVDPATYHQQVCDRALLGPRLPVDREIVHSSHTHACGGGGLHRCVSASVVYTGKQGVSKKQRKQSPLSHLPLLLRGQGQRVPVTCLREAS